MTMRRRKQSNAILRYFIPLISAFTFIRFYGCYNFTLTIDTENIDVNLVPDTNDNWRTNEEGESNEQWRAKSALPRRITSYMGWEPNSNHDSINDLITNREMIFRKDQGHMETLQTDIHNNNLSTGKDVNADKIDTQVQGDVDTPKPGIYINQDLSDGMDTSKSISGSKTETHNEKGDAQLQANRVNERTQGNINDELSSKKDAIVLKSADDKIDTQRKGREEVLPKWIEDYMSWHARMRREFPGSAIITDPKAPKVIVRTCLLALYGGLHDRLGQLPLDLYIANQTQRILLIKWIRPHDLQNFLVPPKDGIDWTFPEGVANWTACNGAFECGQQIWRRVPSMESNYRFRGDPRPDFERLVDNNIHMLNDGELKDVKAAHFTINGHTNEHILEKKLAALGETDMIHNTTTFGAIFRRFFEPHPNVQKEIDNAYEVLGLKPGEYTIAHARVCHPKAYPRGKEFNGTLVNEIDSHGFPFEGALQEVAIKYATRAINCAVTLPNASSDPIYFIADMRPLVQYMTRDLSNETYLSQHSDWFTDPISIHSAAKDVVSKYNIVARDQNPHYIHIDKNRQEPLESYYATFVDLYMTMNARCVSFGIGYYAFFGAKLSGTQCKTKYVTEIWGKHVVPHEKKSDFCTLPETNKEHFQLATNNFKDNE